jgi:hypothetical protein
MAPDWHLSDAVAQVTGLTYAHAFGTHTETFMSHCVINWMGDDAWLKSFDCPLRSVLFTAT